MAFQTASWFIRLRGRDKLIWLRKALNDGISQREIAKLLGVSESRVSQMKKKLLKRQYVWRPGAIDALQFEHSVLVSDADQVKREIEENLS